MPVSIEDLKNALKEEGIRADLIVFGDDDSSQGGSDGPKDDATINEFAGALKLPRGRVLKTVTFLPEDSGADKNASHPVLVVLRDLDRVNLPAVEARLELKLRLAKASEVRVLTGCKIGCVSPFGVNGAKVVLDEGIGDGDVILPAGSELFRAYLKVGFKNLLRLASRLNPEAVPLIFGASEPSQNSNLFKVVTHREL